MFEFKQIWKDEYLKTICAFAKSKGDSLYIGVNDDGNIIGFDNIKNLLETLLNKINNRLGLIVDIILKQQEKREYIEVVVQKIYAPISYNGKFYQRSGSNTIELNCGNLTNFLLKKYAKTWYDIVEERFTLEEISLDTIEKFKKLAKDRVLNIQHEDNVKELLKKLNLYDGKYLKAYISYERMHRREKLEYPRESVINALIHRDYTNTSNLQIKIFDDKLVMYNGATLSHEVPIEKFDKPHQPKLFNPTMATVFYKCGFIESCGRGTNNIISQCMEYGLTKPTFEYDWEAVITTFYKARQKSQDSVINEGINSLYIYIKSNSNQRVFQIEKKLNIPAKTLERWIKQLKDAGKIIYKGSKKTGGYFINE